MLTLTLTLRMSVTELMLDKRRWEDERTCRIAEWTLRNVSVVCKVRKR